jgi:hypothetical protein
VAIKMLPRKEDEQADLSSQCINLGFVAAPSSFQQETKGQM